MTHHRPKRLHLQRKAQQAKPQAAAVPAPLPEADAIPEDTPACLAEPADDHGLQPHVPAIAALPSTEDDTQASNPNRQTTEPQEPAAPPAFVLSGQRSWQCAHEAVVGLSHRNANPPLPCQDAALSRCQPRPTLLVADGAGSAAVSEVGAHAVITATARLLHTLEKQVASLLDEPVTAQELASHGLNARNFALLLVKHAKGVLDDLAEQHRRSARDFRCTLLMIVAGEARALWLKIGDGALVFERRSWLADGSLQAELHTLGAPGKGEFANITQFIDDRLSPADVQSGLLELQDITGLAAMSDGAAEKLIAQDGSRVARQLGHWMEALRQGKLPRRDLTRSFYSEAFCTGTSGDDCSIGILASEVVPAAASACHGRHPGTNPT